MSTASACCCRISCTWRSAPSCDRTGPSSTCSTTSTTTGGTTTASTCISASASNCPPPSGRWTATTAPSARWCDTCTTAGRTSSTDHCPKGGQRAKWCVTCTKAGRTSSTDHCPRGGQRAKWCVTYTMVSWTSSTDHCPRGGQRAKWCVMCTTTGRTSSTYILYAHNELTTVLSPLGQANDVLPKSTQPSYGTVGMTPRQTPCVCMCVGGVSCGTYRDNDIQLYFLVQQQWEHTISIYVSADVDGRTM